MSDEQQDSVDGGTPSPFAEYGPFWPSFREMADARDAPVVEAMKERQQFYLARWDTEEELKVGDTIYVSGPLEAEVKIPCRILREPTLTQQIIDMEPENAVSCSSEVLAGYRMAQADALFIVEMYEKEEL